MKCDRCHREIIAEVYTSLNTYAHPATVDATVSTKWKVETYCLCSNCTTDFRTNFINNGNAGNG